MHELPRQREKLPVEVIRHARQLLFRRVIPVIDVEQPGTPAFPEPQLQVLVTMRVEPHELVLRQPHPFAETIFGTFILKRAAVLI